MAEGRLPVSGKNIEYMALDDADEFRAKVAEVSADADLVVVGFDLDGLRERRAGVFENHPDLGDVLFVRAPTAIRID